MQQNQKTRERSYSHQSSTRRVQQNASTSQQQKPLTNTSIPTTNLQPFQTNIERPQSNRNDPSTRQINQQMQQLKGSSLNQTQSYQVQEVYTQKIKESPYYTSIQRPQTSDRVRNQVMNLQQVYNVKPQTAQNSHRLDKSQQEDQLRYSTPIQKKSSQTSTAYATSGQQQPNQQLQSSSNNFYQLGKSIGSQQGSYITKSKQSQSNQNETKLPQFQTPQPLKELSKSQQQPHGFAQTQYSTAQYSLQQQKPKQPQQVLQNYLGTSEKEKQGIQNNTQMKIKKGQEVSKRIDFSNESNMDNLLLLGKGEEIKSSSSSEFTSQQESPVYGEKYSNDQLKQNAKLSSQNQGQQLSSKQQRVSVQSNQRVDSNISHSKQLQGEITNNQQYSRPKSPNEIYSSHSHSQKQKPLSTQPKKLAETSENFYKQRKSPYEKLSSQTLKNFYISKSKPQEKPTTGSRKRIYSTNQSDVSYNQKQSASFSKGPQQDLYQNIDISLSSLDQRKQKQQNQPQYDPEDDQYEKEEKKEDFHSSVIDYNFDFTQFQNLQRPPCRKKLNTFNVEGIGANKGPVKPRHDIQLGEPAQNPLRPPSRHKLPPKNLGLGFSESEESGEDIPVKEMFQRTQVERNELVFSNDYSLLKPKKLSDQFNLDQFSLQKNEDEHISKTFNLNEDRSLQSREVQLSRPKSSRTNRSKSHISKQGTETQIPEDPLFDDEFSNNDILKQKKNYINDYVNQLDIDDQLISNRSQLKGKTESQQQNQLASKVLAGSDIVIKHNVSRKKPNLDKIQLPIGTKLGVEFIGLFANYQEGEQSQAQTPQTSILKQQYQDQILRQQQQNVYSTPSPHSVQQQGYDFGHNKNVKPDEFDDFEEEEEEEQKQNPSY